MGSSNGNNRTSRLVVIESDKNARDYVKRSLAVSGLPVRIVGEASEIADGMRLARGLQPDMILLELPINATDTLDKVKQLRDERPHTAVIISTHAPSPQLILSCMRAGVAEFVGHPIDGPEVEKAVDRVRRSMGRTVAGTRPSGLLLSVFAPKGGIGATCVTANLGAAFASREGTRTIVVDLSFQMGDLALMFDEPPKYSLVDAFDNGHLDESKLRTMISSHGSGTDILTVAAGPEVAEDIARQHIVELFGTLNTLYDVVVVDVGRQLDDRSLEALELSDGIIMLTVQDVPTNRSVSRHKEIFHRLEFDTSKIQLVVNRFHKKSRLSVRDIEVALGVDVFWSIPNEFAPISVGIDAGNPAVLEAPRSKVARSFRDLAAALSQFYEDRSFSEPTKQAVSH